MYWGKKDQLDGGWSSRVVCWVMLDHHHLGYAGSPSLIRWFDDESVMYRWLALVWSVDMSK